MLKTCSNCGAPLPTKGELDGRSGRWYARVRVYRAGVDEPLADSDPNLEPGQLPHDVVLAGLPEVAQYAAQAGQEAVEQPTKGLDRETLAHRLKSLRPTLSRRGGNAVWRIPFDTLETWREGPDHHPAFMVRVDLERAP